MGIKFDLRTSEYIERERRRNELTLSKFIAVTVLVLFMSSSIFYIIMATRKIDILNNLIDIKTQEFNAHMSAQKILLDEIKNLNANEREILNIFEFMDNQPPVLETLNILEANICNGILIKSIKFTNVHEGKYRAEINAAASGNDVIIDFAGNLNKSIDALNLNMRKVDVPAYTRGGVTFILNYF